MAPRQSPVFDAAVQMVGWGFSVIPTGGKDDFEETLHGKVSLNKRPIWFDRLGARGLKWDKFKDKPPTEAELRKMFPPEVENMGVLMGGVSTDCEAIDFDLGGMFEAWREILIDNGHEDLLSRLYIQASQTPGRFHCFYRCPGGIEAGRKLSHYYDPDEIDEHTGKPKRKCSVEVRAEGQYILGAPSKGYTPIQGSFGEVPEVTAEERGFMLYAAELLDTAPDEKTIYKPKESLPRDNARLRPGDDFNNRASWGEILEPLGGSFLRMRGSLAHWMRPGKSDHTTGAVSGLGHAGEDLLKMWTTNWSPFEPGQSYSKFAAYALLHHHGDFAAAASELSRKGYGDKPKAPASSAAANRQAIIDQISTPHGSADDQGEAGWLRDVRVLWSTLEAEPPKEMLVEGLIGKMDSAMIAGKRKGGKSAVIIDLMLAMLGGRDFAGRFEIPRPLRVAYFTTEGRGGIGTRVKAANLIHQIPFETIEENWFFFPKMPQLFDADASRSVIGFAQEMACLGVHFDVIVLDTFAKSILGAKENDNSEMSLALATLAEARSIMGCASLLVHHAGRDGGLRGASAIDGDLDIQIWVDWDEDAGTRALRHGFAKDVTGFEDIPFKIHSVEIGTPGSLNIQWEGSPVNVGGRNIETILFFMRQDPDNIWTVGQLQNFMPEIPVTSLKTALRREFLRSNARIDFVKVGASAIRYQLSEEGKVCD